MVIDRARDILAEVAGNQSTSHASPNMVLTLVGVISIVGFTATTIGSLVFYRMDQGNSPMPFLFGLGGFAAMIMICRYLLALIKPAAVKGQAGAYSPPKQVPGGGQIPALPDPSAAYQSVVEDRTKQFDTERKLR